MPLFNPSAQAETFVLIRAIRGRTPISASWKYSYKFVRFVGETPSAQAETFVKIRIIRGRNSHQRKLKHSWKFVKFVGETPSAQAENIRANSWDSWVKLHQRKLKHSYQFVQFVGKTSSAQAETFVQIRVIHRQKNISVSWKQIISTTKNNYKNQKQNDNRERTLL